MRPVPSDAAAFVARHEGLRLESYQDTGGVWTIGYGHTGADVHAGLRISLGKAKAWLAQDLRVAAARLQAVVTRPVIDDLTENQYAALLSFVFNLGAEPRWTIWKVLNARQFDQVPVQLMRFVEAKETAHDVAEAAGGEAAVPAGVLDRWAGAIDRLRD